jgi:hypothetical protein
MHPASSRVPSAGSPALSPDCLRGLRPACRVRAGAPASRRSCASSHAPNRFVPVGLRHALGQVVFAGCIAVGLVMRVAVGLAVAEFLHQLGRRIAQMERHRTRDPSLATNRARHYTPCKPRCSWPHRPEDHRLRQRQLAFRRAEALVGRQALRRSPAPADRPGRCPPPPCAPAPAEIERVGAAIEHAAQPVQRGIGIGAAHRLVQRRDLVVEGLAALVEAAQVAVTAPRRRKCGVTGFAWRSRRPSPHLLEQIEQPPRVAIGKADQASRGIASSNSASRAGERTRALEQLAASRRLVSGFSTYTAARDSSAAVDLERRILGGGADEDDGPCSTNGRKASCCALLKRCTSSTNRMVWRPRAGGLTPAGSPRGSP